MMDGWDPATTSAKPEVGLGISFGDVTYLGEAEVGYFIAGNYGNSWSQRDNGQRRTYGGAAAIVADDFVFQTATNNIEASALASLGVAIGDSTFEWNNLISRDTESFGSALLASKAMAAQSWARVSNGRSASTSRHRFLAHIS